MDRIKLLNKKLFYGGKSSSSSNWIEFVHTNEQTINLLVHYVFDRAAYEYEDFSFALSNDEFNFLIDNLNSNRSAELKKDDLYFVWRWNDGHLEFKIEGRSVSPFSGSFRYQLPEFVVIDNIDLVNG